MSLLKRLFGKKRFRHFPDSFTLSRDNQMATLCQWVTRQLEAGVHVLVLTQFRSSFLETQTALNDAGIDFDIVAQPVSEQQLMALLLPAKKQPQVLITMSQMLRASSTTGSQTLGGDSEIAVIVTEHYPLPGNDERIVQFFRQLDAFVSVGYLLSFEDPVLRHVMGATFIELMKQLGLGENDLVSSTMTNHGFSRRLRKLAGQITEERPADSPQEWLDQNL